MAALKNGVPGGMPNPTRASRRPRSSPSRSTRNDATRRRVRTAKRWTRRHVPTVRLKRLSAFGTGVVYVGKASGACDSAYFDLFHGAGWDAGGFLILLQVEALTISRNTSESFGQELCFLGV